MEKKTKNRDDFTRQLIELEKLGIETDRQRIKKNMCAQFANYREWIREYAVNASDAMATECVISGYETGDEITIVVKDNGKGMDKSGIEDFFTLYRSRKDQPANMVVGRHGIGKLSVAAIPGQNHFEMITSTGSECRMAVTGSLLNEDPIRISRIEPVPPAGTEFRITFTRLVPLREELELLREILEKYVCFLDCIIAVEIPDNEDDQENNQISLVNRKWPGQSLPVSRDYNIKIGNHPFRVTLGIGKQQQLIYQNKVCITGKYDLLSFDRNGKWDVPVLSIMVDSPSFELPFGRHCLSNEEILRPLSNHIRTKLLPEFYQEIFRMYKSGLLKEFKINDYAFAVLTSHLMLYDNSVTSPWLDTPVFRMVSKMTVSFNELDTMVRKAGKIYLASDTSAGADFSVFDGPVMMNEQYGCCSEIIKNHFGNQLIDLCSGSLVMEKPGLNNSVFSDEEQEFEKNLGFHPGLFRKLESNETGSMETDLKQPDPFTSGEKVYQYNGTSKEAQHAKSELENIGWRISYLVEKDGVSPNRTHLFLYNGNEVILNLHHPDIRQLVRLTRHNPGLAGHWAMAICLLDDRNILPYISAATREDLLVLDAMEKIRNSKPAEVSQNTTGRSQWFDIFRRMNDINLN